MIDYYIFLLSFSQGLCMVLEASCKDGGGIIFNLVDNLLGGLLSMVSFFSQQFAKLWDLSDINLELTFVYQ